MADHTYKCVECDKFFASQYSLDRHMESFYHFKQDEDNSKREENDNADEDLKSNEDINDDESVTHEDDESVTTEDDKSVTTEDDKSVTTEDDESVTTEDDESVTTEEDDTDDENGTTDEDSSTSETDEENEVDVFNNLVNEAYAANQHRQDRIFRTLLESGYNNQEAYRLSFDEILPQYKKSLRSMLVDKLIHIEDVKNHYITKAIMKKVRKLETKGMDLEEAMQTAVAYRKHLVNRLVPSYDEMDNYQRLEDNDSLAMDYDE